MIDTTELAAAFVELSDTLVDDFDLLEMLRRLTLRAAQVSGAKAVGLMLLDKLDRPHFMAASNESGRLMELMQLQGAEGPCLDCISTGVPVVNADLGHAVERWPTFAPQARAAGFQSVHAFPMRLRSQAIGALNLFGGSDTTFADDEVRVVQALADIATIGILQERSLTRAEITAAQLQSALDTRVIIEQAKGALAQAEGISIDAAFELIRSTARSGGHKLIDVARVLVNDMSDGGYGTSLRRPT